MLKYSCMVGLCVPGEEAVLETFWEASYASSILEAPSVKHSDSSLIAFTPVSFLNLLTPQSRSGNSSCICTCMHVQPYLPFILSPLILRTHKKATHFPQFTSTGRCCMYISHLKDCS